MMSGSPCSHSGISRLGRPAVLSHQGKSQGLQIDLVDDVAEDDAEASVVVQQHCLTGRLPQGVVQPGCHES